MKKYTFQKINIPSGNYCMKLLILSPTACKQPREQTPGILWIHGGGYAVGMAEMVFMSRAKRLVTEYGAVVISPEYRLAGKSPYPTALEDCYKALLYLKEHATDLGCAYDQIMVGGRECRRRPDSGIVYAGAGARRSEYCISDVAVSDAGSQGY